MTKSCRMCKSCENKMYHPRTWSTKVTNNITVQSTMRMCSRCGPRMTRHLAIHMFGRKGSLHIQEVFSGFRSQIPPGGVI